MKRRQFISLLGGAAAAWPMAARAQHGKVRRIGVLSGASRETAFSNYEGFLQGMRELGYVEGRDFVIEYRFAEGKYDRFPDFAAELVRSEPGKGSVFTMRLPGGGAPS
jgi:DNA-binding LacI/PurR family transcriptional regulator